MITVLSVLGCTLGMTNSWLVAQGKLRPVYRLGIALHLCFITINSMLAYAGQPGLLFLTVPSLWGIVTCVMGLRRLARQGATHVPG